MLAQKEAYYLKDWYIQPEQLKITGVDGVQISVEPKIMGVLQCLVVYAGEVVSRDTLMEVVWEDCIVVEDTLTRCVSQLRKMLGDDPEAPVFIETIRSKGYRLLIAPADKLPVRMPQMISQLAANRMALAFATTCLLVFVFLFGWRAGFKASDSPIAQFNLGELPAGFLESDSTLQALTLSNGDSMVFFLDKNAPNKWVQKDSLFSFSAEN